MRRVLWVILGRMVVSTLAFGGVVRSNGVPLRLMDPDENGHVTPRELVRSLELGVRPVEEGGKPCRAVCRLKDGIRLGVVCEG